MPLTLAPPGVYRCAMSTDTTPLAALLQKHRLRQVDLAEALSVSRVTVSLWAAGKAMPSGPNLVRITMFLREYDPLLRVEQLLAADDQVVA